MNRMPSPLTQTMFGCPWEVITKCMWTFHSKMNTLQKDRSTWLAIVDSWTDTLLYIYVPLPRTITCTWLHLYHDVIRLIETKWPLRVALSLLMNVALTSYIMAYSSPKTTNRFVWNFYHYSRYINVQFGLWLLVGEQCLAAGSVSIGGRAAEHDSLGGLGYAFSGSRVMVWNFSLLWSNWQ